MRKQDNKGFSMIELLVTILIISIVAVIGVPSFQGAMRGSRLTSAVNELATSFSLARSEAIKTNRYVSVCRKNSAAATTCKTGSGASDGWEVGWIVFVDMNSNGEIDGASTNKGDAADCAIATNDCILKTYSALSNNFTLRPTSSGKFVNVVRYTPKGITSEPSSDGFYACDISQSTVPQTGTAKVLLLNAIGRTRVATDTSPVNGIPEIWDSTAKALKDITTCTP
jgi:type IV fimbrial biogenesis protein FimT